jgi:hypothetical protein
MIDKKEIERLKREYSENQLRRLMPIDSAAKRLNNYLKSDIPSKKSTNPNKWTMHKGKPKKIDKDNNQRN